MHRGENRRGRCQIDLRNLSAGRSFHQGKMAAAEFRLRRLHLEAFEFRDSNEPLNTKLFRFFSRNCVEEIERHEIRRFVGVPMRKSASFSNFEHPLSVPRPIWALRDVANDRRAGRAAIAGGTPALLVHEFPAVADVVREDVLAEAVGGRVEGAAAIDLR